MAQKTQIRTDTASGLVTYATRHGVDLLSDRFEFNRHPEDLPRGVSLITGTTPDGGELVVVEGSVAAESVTLNFVERDGPDGGDYVYETSVEAFYARVEADGGWYEVPTAVRTKPANCPACGSFMTVHEGREGFGGDSSHPWFSWAGCGSCGHDVGHDYLVDEGAVVELRL